jgi:hypothetical protein
MQSNWYDALEKQRSHEWHVTVAPSSCPVRWHRFCEQFGLKPLWIELNNFSRQLMCAAHQDVSEDCILAGFPVIRVKHEVSSPLHGEEVLYYECHVKLDGPFRPGAPKASRDLYRENRWYVTQRETKDFSPRPFVEWVRGHPLSGELKVVAYEYEACLEDSNPELDARWN